MVLNFTLLKDDYSIYSFKIDSTVPSWVYDSDFYSITKTKDELSIVCKTVDISSGDRIKIDRHWRILKIDGFLDLSEVGIMAEISSLFKENEIPIFTLSTFNTDYILFKLQYLNKAISILVDAGHKIITNS